MKRLLLVLIPLIFSCSSEEFEFGTPEIEAEAQIFSLEKVGEDTYDPQAKQVGTAKFYQAGNVVKVMISLEGMTPDSYKAVHIHRGTVQNPGRHWNRGSYIAACDTASMGERWGRPFVGDIGNVPIGADGTGDLVIFTDLWSINTGDRKDILDKTIIVHEYPEDFAEECNPAHVHDHLHFNLKIGGGSIVLASDIPKVEQSTFEMERLPDFTICR
ncbi:MAG: hypothetical protein Tsb0034_05480 [Ekhidna sp.]